MENDNARSLSEAEILRLHQEQDPASPLFKGSVPAGASVSGTAAENPEPASAYYEPTADKVDPIADAIQAPAGTTAFTTEEVSKPYEAPEAEQEATPQVSSESSPEVTKDTEDAGITGT